MAEWERRRLDGLVEGQMVRTKVEVDSDTWRRGVAHAVRMPDGWHVADIKTSDMRECGCADWVRRRNSELGNTGGLVEMMISAWTRIIGCR